MTDDLRRALQAMAEQQQADATAALIAVKDILQRIIDRSKDMAAVLRDDGEPQ